MDEVLNDSEEVDKNDSEILEECEKELEQMMDVNNVDSHADQGDSDNIVLCEKRRRGGSEDSNDDGFFTVTRRKINSGLGIRSLRKTTRDLPTDMINKIDPCTFEVCLTALEVLPKQMAFAKLLREQNIRNVIRIRYKSAYRVFIHFDNLEQAESLMKCPKMKNMNIRCQFTDQLNACYGVVKGIDIEMSDEEVLESIDSSSRQDIVSLKRLKRMNEQGKWVDSESIRISFKNDKRPEFITAYGCRFHVETYYFPVTQCSACWKFGHIRKFCSLGKIVCPKCGLEHGNCETKVFKCVNCKGAHMSLDKRCPVFKKEQVIRKIMSENNVTYKKALEIFYSKKQLHSAGTQDYTITEFPSLPTRAQRSPVLTLNEELQPDDSPNLSSPMNSQPYLDAARRKKKKTTEIINKNQGQEFDWINDFDCDPEMTENKNKEKEEGEKKEEWKFEWKEIFKRIKEIAFSEKNMKIEEKCLLIFKLILSEIKKFVYSMFADGNILKKILGL